MISGYGNNGSDYSEGSIYKNCIGSYLHGPVLPLNPNFCLHFLALAVCHKYGSSTQIDVTDTWVELAHMDTNRD